MERETARPRVDLSPTRNCRCLAARREARELTRLYEEKLRPYGLRATQFSILAALGQMGATPLTDVAEVLGLERTSLTRSADVMERNGWIEDAPSDDGRKRPLRLTEAGRRKVEAAFPAWKEAQDIVDGRRGDGEAGPYRPPNRRSPIMIEPPEITETTEENAAVIHLEIPRSKMQEVFGAALDELLGVLDDQDIEPAGAVFAHHLRMAPDTFDFELGVPVSEPIAAAGRVKAGKLPGATVARTVYHGPYEGLPDAWGDFDAWMEENGYEQDRDLWERYVEGPHSSPDPADWRTELNRPLVG